VTNEAILDAAYLNALIDLGAQYLILDLSDLPRHPKQYPMIFMDTHYAIYQLEASGNLQ
jgi:hypothetical protein